ncbi:MAG: HEAT repeat domain-containing protein [Treponema sp.]|jgi:HEAT repeat protein|nr:HEAT repeat domain-containing protein [Treponema sp.]
MNHVYARCVFVWVFFSLTGTLFSQETSSQKRSTPASVSPVKSEEERRLDTIHYGTETEIAALIQTLKSENTDYLDDELITLMQNTRNRNILAGVFSFFGDRNKEGLEERAIQAIENRDDEANEIVFAAIDYLGKVKAAAAISPLEKLLDTEERRFMGSTFKALGRVSGDKGDEVAAYLLDYYTNRNPGDENRREIITALGETGSKASVSFLADIAGNNEERVVLRIAAVDALSKIGDDTGLEAILQAVSAADPNIRSTALTALGPFSGNQVDATILESFRDSYYRTRIGAADAAAKRKLTGAVPYLRFRAENDEVPTVKDAAIRSLGAIGNQEALSSLESLFTERKTPDRVRLLAAEMLINNNADTYADQVIVELDEAKRKNQTALYNGFLKAIGGAKTKRVEDLTRRFFASGGVIEKSYALDMTANNEFRSLATEVRALTEDKNGSLARKAQGTLQKLGLTE